jgi:hypothetical protein
MAASLDARDAKHPSQAMDATPVRWRQTLAMPIERFVSRKTFALFNEDTVVLAWMRVVVNRIRDITDFLPSVPTATMLVCSSRANMHPVRQCRSQDATNCATYSAVEPASSPTFR